MKGQYVFKYTMSCILHCLIERGGIIGGRGRKDHIKLINGV